METKICNRCGKEKPISEFCFRRDSGQYRNPCKECRNKYLKEYADKHKLELKEYRDNYYRENKDKKIEYQRDYSKKNKERISKYRKKYREEHLEDMHEYKIKHYIENKDSIQQKNREYYYNNAEKIRQKSNEYSKENREKINQYVRTRKKENKLFKLRLQVRNMIWESFNRKGNKKNYSSEKILGCKLSFFMDYLLETFKKNYGYDWDGIEDVHIDHIIPLASAKTEQEIIDLCHYTNLQLLKAKDNLEKNAKENWNINK